MCVSNTIIKNKCLFKKYYIIIIKILRKKYGDPGFYKYNLLTKFLFLLILFSKVFYT